MILSNVSIHEAMDRGWLSINPEPVPRLPVDGRCPYDTSAVDLRLGDEISWFDEGAGFVIDLTRGGFRTLFAKNSQRRTISVDQPYVLRPQKMVLGKTMETVSLPIVKDVTCLAARVEGKSSYARCGLLVHFTAPTIHSSSSAHLSHLAGAASSTAH